MTESQSPLDVALDLLVYAPVGLALTAAEEIPKLAAKGRTQVGGQLAMARVVGQFAVSQGRKELQKRFNPAPSNRAAPEASAGSAGTPASGPGSGSQPPSESPVARGEVSYEDLLAAPGSEVASEARLIGATPEGMDGGAADADGAVGDGGHGWSSPRAPAGTGDAAHPAVKSLAIPGYDSLAASQVVQRLAGLSREELEAVGAYEATHRSRRTILSRIRQLQGS